jgi:hypothetical protein
MPHNSPLEHGGPFMDVHFLPKALQQQAYRLGYVYTEVEAKRYICEKYFEHWGVRLLI